jgi:plasmid stabilization system protein ParE
MLFKIEISEEAENQIFEAYFYYAEISESLGKSFNTELINTIDYLGEKSGYFQSRYNGVRIVLTKKFPYSVHYVIKNETVFVLKILHQKQFYK